MSNFFRLFRAQFNAIINGNFNAGKQNGTKKRFLGGLGGYAFLMVFILAYAAVFEYIYIRMFSDAGYADAMITFVIVAASALSAISAISASKSLIFTSRDYDILAAMPIKSGTIVASKLFTFYVFELITTVLFMLPCGIIYGIGFKSPPYFYLAFYLIMLLVPIVPIVIGSVIGAFVSWISVHFKYSKLVGTVIYIAFFVGVMYFSMSLSSVSDGLTTGVLVATVLKMWKIYPMAKLAVMATVYSGGSALSLLEFIGISLAAFALVCVIFGLCYKKIHTAFAARFTGAKYSVSGGGDSPLRACIKKEFARFFSSSLLIMNSMAGIIMMLIFAVLIGVRYDSLLASFSSGEGGASIGNILGGVVPFLLGMCASIACTTNSSISLEGSSIYLLKSFPVSAMTVLRAKLTVHMVLTFSGVAIGALIIAFTTGLSPAVKLMTFLLPLAYSYFIGLLGLWLNLRRPNFEWTNETAVIKQSFPVMVTSLGGMAIGLIPMMISGGLAQIIPPYIFPIIMCALLLVLSLCLRAKLQKNGENLYRAL